MFSSNLNSIIIFLIIIVISLYFLYKVTIRKTSIIKVINNKFSFFFKKQLGIFNGSILSFTFFVTYTLKLIIKPVVIALKYIISVLAVLGDVIKAHKIAKILLLFLTNKILYVLWYFKKYWLYKPLRFFYIYISLYLLNIFPKNRDLGFEDTFFFRGYKLYSLENSILLRRHLFSNGKIKIIAPEGLYWKKKEWKDENFDIFQQASTFFFSKTNTVRNQTDFSFFYNIWSKTRNGKFWFVNKDIILSFPKINDFSFGTEFSRIINYKSWKHSYLNRQLYQAPFNRSVVAQRMLDYSSYFNENIFSKKNSFSYFFSFYNTYKTLPYKNIKQKPVRLNKWSFSEKYFYNRDSQYGFIFEHSLKNSMPTYYARVSKLHQNNFYNEEFSKTFNFVKSIEDLYSNNKNFFSNRQLNGILNSTGTLHDILNKKRTKQLDKISIKMFKSFLTSNNTNFIPAKNPKFSLDMIKATWSNDKIYSFLSHKILSEEKNGGLWDSYFKDLVFYGPGPHKRPLTSPDLTNYSSNNLLKDINKRIKNEYAHPYISRDFFKNQTIKDKLNLDYYETNNMYKYYKSKKPKKSFFRNPTQDSLKDFNKKDQLHMRETPIISLWKSTNNKDNGISTNARILTRLLNKQSPNVFENESKALNSYFDSIKITGIGRSKPIDEQKRENFFLYNPYDRLSVYFLNFPFYDRIDAGEDEEIDMEDFYKNYGFYDFDDMFQGSTTQEGDELSTKYAGPDVSKLYNFYDIEETEPEELERLLFTNNLLSKFNFSLDSKYFDNNYYYQIYPALFNQSNMDFYYTDEYLMDRDEPEVDEEEDNDPFFELQSEYEFIPEVFTEDDFDDAEILTENMRYYPYSFSQIAHPTRPYHIRRKGEDIEKGFIFQKQRQISQDFTLPDYTFYSDSIRYSDVFALDFLKKIYTKNQITRENSFFNTSSIISDIKNYRINHLYSKIFFNKNFREQNFYNSRTDRAFVQKEKTSTLTYPSGKLKSPTKYDYYFVNKVGNRGFIDFKSSSKFLNENYLVNFIKLQESSIISYIWNDLPSNFLVVELKYILVDFFHNKCSFLNTGICFTLTRILLSMSDRLLYEIISSVKIYVISWFSVVIDDIIGLYMRYYLLLLDHNTLLFISRKNVSYGSYTIVSSRDRTFENRRLFGLKDMRRRFYKGVGIVHLTSGSTSNLNQRNNDIFHYNNYIKMYTKIRGSNLGFYEKYATRRSPSQTKKYRHGDKLKHGVRKKFKLRKYRESKKRSLNYARDSMTFNQTGLKGSVYFNKKVHSNPHNHNKPGFIVISRSKVTFKPGNYFRFGKLYMKFRFRPIMLRFSNSTYFFKYKNLSSSIFTEFNRFPFLKRKFMDFYKYSDISFKSKNITRNLKVLPTVPFINLFTNAYKNKSTMLATKFPDVQWGYFGETLDTNNLPLVLDLRIGFSGDLEKHFMVNNSYGINDYLMRYSVAFKFLDLKNSLTLYNSDFYMNKEFFDNYFVYSFPTNYKLRFLKITDLLLVDFIKWKKYYVKGHNAWIGENARVYNLDFYKNSNVRRYKRHLNFKARNFKIREIPFKINQRYSYSLYKNPFLKYKDNDYIKSLFYKKGEIKPKGIEENDIIYRRRRHLLKKKFKGYKYLEYYSNILRKRKHSPYKIYFRTYNRNFYDFARNFKTKRKPAYRVPLSFSYFNRRTLFYDKFEKSSPVVFLHRIYSFLRRLGSIQNYGIVNHALGKGIISRILGPGFVKMKQIFYTTKSSSIYLTKKFNFPFYNESKTKDSSFTFFDIRNNFHTSVIKLPFYNPKNTKIRRSRRVVTFWNKNYFLKLRKTGYNNLVFRKTYKTRDNVLKLRKFRNKFKNLNYFIFNPRFWNSKGYDSLLTGFDVGYLYKKGYRSNLKHYQLIDLTRKRKSWLFWKYLKHYKAYKYKKAWFPFKRTLKLQNYLFNLPLYKISDSEKDVIRILNHVNRSNLEVFSYKNYRIKPVFPFVTKIVKKNAFIKNIIGLPFAFQNDTSTFKKIKTKDFIFYNKIILNMKNRSKSKIFKFNFVNSNNIKFLINSYYLTSIFETQTGNYEIVKFKTKVYFSFLFRKHFSNFKLNYKNSFLLSKISKSNFYNRKKSFLDIFDHLYLYKFKLSTLKPSSYRYYLKKNNFFLFFKSNVHKKMFYYMSKFFYNYLNIYSDFIDFMSRLQRESLFHKTFRKNSHIKFFFYRFFNRNYSNFLLVDKNYSYLNFIFNRKFKNSIFFSYKSDFINYFLKYKRYHYNKHQYSRFRKPKYLSLIDAKKTYADFINKKINLNNYNKKKKSLYLKSLSSSHKVFLNRLWNVVNVRSSITKGKHKQFFKFFFEDQNDIRGTMYTIQSDKFLEKMIKEVLKNYYSKKGSRKDPHILNMLKQRNSLIAKKLKLSKQDSEPDLTIFLDQEIRKLQKNIIERFFGISLDNFSLRYLEGFSDDDSKFKTGISKNFSSKNQYIYPVVAATKLNTMNFYNRFNNPDEFLTKLIKNSKSPFRDNKVFNYMYGPESTLLGPVKRMEGLQDQIDEEDSNTTNVNGFYYTMDKDLIKNYNKIKTPFAWRNYKNSSSFFKKNNGGLNQFSRRILFNRRYGFVIEPHKEQTGEDTTNQPYTMTEEHSSDWFAYKEFMDEKEQSKNINTFISKAYPTKTTKNKLWSKSKFKKQKIFLLNFAKSKKYVAFQHLYSSRFTYNRGQKNYYRDRSLQNVVFDQNFKAQKFFEILRAKRNRIRKVKHSKYNRSRNIRSAIFESRLKTRFWLRNQYFNKVKKKPSLFLDGKIVGTNINYTKRQSKTPYSYKEVHDGIYKKKRRGFDDKRKKKTTRKLDYSSKLIKIPYFDVLLKKSRSFGKSFKAVQWLDPKSRKGLNYKIPYKLRASSNTVEALKADKFLIARKIIDNLLISDLSDNKDILNNNYITSDFIVKTKKLFSGSKKGGENLLEKNETTHYLTQGKRISSYFRKEKSKKKNTKSEVNKVKHYTRLMKSIKQINTKFGSKSRYLRRRSSPKTRSLYNYRSSFGLKTNQSVLGLFFNLKSYNKVFYFPSLIFKNRIKNNLKNNSLLNINYKIKKFFEKHSKFDKLKDSNLLFFFKYKSYVMDNISNKNNKIKLAWYFLKSFQENSLLNKIVKNQIETEKFGNFYVVDGKFTYGKKLNNYIAKNKLYTLDFDLLYDSRRFKTRYYRRKIPFKTILSAKSHYFNYKQSSIYDSIHTSYGKNLNYMFGYSNSKKINNNESLIFNKKQLQERNKLLLQKKSKSIQNLLYISENIETDLINRGDVDKATKLPKERGQVYDPVFYTDKAKPGEVLEIEEGPTSKSAYTRDSHKRWKDFGLKNQPRLAMNYKREHFKHYYFYTSKRQRYNNKFVEKLSKACVLRIDVLLVIHLIRGFFYYLYRVFIVYLYSLKIFGFFALLLIFYKIFVFLWTKNVLPDLISLRNVYFLSNKLIERKFLNSFDDFYKEGIYKKNQFFFKRSSRICKTDYFLTKKYYDRSANYSNTFYLNDKYFVRNFLFSYNKEYKKNFVSIWTKGFFTTIKDSLNIGLFLFLFFCYRLFVILLNFLVNFFFKYIFGELLLWFSYFFNLFYNRILFFGLKKDKKVTVFNFLFSFFSFCFRKLLLIIFVFAKIIFFIIVLIFYSVFIFSYLKYYNLTLTELPSTLLVLFLHALFVFFFSSISQNLKNLFVESKINNIFPESIFNIGKEDRESALSPFFEFERNYYPENHFIDYDKLMYSVLMDKVLGASSDQNPATYYLGNHVSSNYRETSFAPYPRRFKYSWLRKLRFYLSPLKKSFRNEDFFSATNNVVGKNYIIPNEISQKITDSNTIQNFFYKSTILPIIDLFRLTNIFNEKSLFLNFKQIYTLKFKFLYDYRTFYRLKNRTRKNLKMKVPLFIKNHWIQRVKLKRKNSINTDSRIHYKLYSNKVHKINNFNFFTYKNYQLVPKILNPYRKYLVLVFLLQFREYKKVQLLYNEYIKDVYYPFSYQDGMLWDDLFDHFDFSNRSIWPSTDFGLFFQRKFREEFALKNRIDHEIKSSKQEDPNSLLFLLRIRENKPDYNNIYKKYKNSWFLDYDKIEYIKDIDKFEESIKVFTTRESNRIISIFEEDDDEGQSMLEEQHYLMDETDLSVYYDDHIFTVEDSSLCDFDTIATFNMFKNKLNVDVLNFRKIDNIYKEKAFSKIFFSEYQKYKKIIKKYRYIYGIDYLKEKDFFKNRKEKIMKKVHKEYLLQKKLNNYSFYNKIIANKQFKYKYSVEKKILIDETRELDYKSGIFFGMDSGSFLYRGSFFDPRVSPRRINNILKHSNDIEFQDNNWLKNIIEKRLFVDTTMQNETATYLFKNNIMMSDIDKILFCDIVNNENGLGRLSDYGAFSFWDDHVWITSSSEFRKAVSGFFLNLDKKYKVQYNVGIFEKNNLNTVQIPDLKKIDLTNKKQKVSRLHYYKKDPLDNILHKKLKDEKVHSLDFESYRNRGQFIDFPTDFEALNKQFSFVPVKQIASVNDINISDFKIWFKEIFWYQLYDNRFKRIFFENFQEICEFLDLRHFPVLTLEEAERLWVYLGCTESEWDFIELDKTTITVPFGSDEIIFFFLLAYFINSVPTTNSVGHPRTMYGIEDSSKIAVYYRNFTFFKMYDFIMNFLRSFLLSIHWSKDAMDFLNLYKYPFEKISGTYTTYPYIPYNKFFNPFSKYWTTSQTLDPDSIWAFQTYYINMHRNSYPNSNYNKSLSKVSWINMSDKNIENFYLDRWGDSSLTTKYLTDIFENDKMHLPLYRLGSVRNYAMTRKNSVFFSSNAAEIGWNDRGYAMNYFQRFNSLAKLPQHSYLSNFRLPLHFEEKWLKLFNLKSMLSKILLTSSISTYITVKHSSAKIINDNMQRDWIAKNLSDISFLPFISKKNADIWLKDFFQNIQLKDIVNYFYKYYDLAFLKTNSRRYSMLDGFNNDFFISKKPFLLREKILEASYNHFGNYNLNITNMYSKLDDDLEDWVFSYENDQNKFSNFFVVPSYKKYTISNYFPEPLLHTPSIPLINFRHRVLFNYDWFYIKCIFTVVISSYIILSMFFSPFFFLLVGFINFIFIKLLFYLSFFFSDLLIINIYNFIYNVVISFYVNYFLLIKLYFLIIFDLFYYILDINFLFFIFKSIIWINIIELLNIEYWISLLQFLIALCFFIFKNMLFHDFFTEINFFIQKYYFFIEHLFFFSYKFNFLFSEFFNHGIDFFLLVSSFFYYPYYYFPHIYISFVHTSMVFFHIFVNIMFVEYFTVYMMFIDIKPTFFLLYDFISDFYFYKNNLLIQLIMFFSYFLAQIILYLILICSFVLFYLLYFVHMFFQLLSLFYVIFFFFT